MGNFRPIVKTYVCVCVGAFLVCFALMVCVVSPHFVVIVRNEVCVYVGHTYKQFRSVTVLAATER